MGRRGWGAGRARVLFLLTSGMLLDLYRTPRPLEAITEAGTNPNAVPLEKFIIEGEESSDSGSAQLFPLFPLRNLQWCWVCRRQIKSAASLFCDASVLFHLR